jgi:hypothetical protein
VAGPSSIYALMVVMRQQGPSIEFAELNLVVLAGSLILPASVPGEGAGPLGCGLARRGPVLERLTWAVAVTATDTPAPSTIATRSALTAS